MSKPITVGSSDAQIKGITNAEIQQAVDACAKAGGGRVRLAPETFTVYAPVRLAENVTLEGSGAETVLRKCDGFRSRFVIDADYGQLKVTVEDASGFAPGMGITIWDEPRKGGWAVTTAVITGIKGAELHFDTHLERDYSADQEGMVSNACSVVAGTDLKNAGVRDLTIDGNKAENGFLNGCRGGGVYFQKARNCRVDSLTIKEFNGDGISWQTTEDMTVTGCEIRECSYSGIHPGSGSARSSVEECYSHHNGTDGMFVCWRVQEGVFKANRFEENTRTGICIGHKDSDNLFTENLIRLNGSHGVAYREEKETNGAHRNRFVKNRVEDNTGCAFFIAPVNNDTVIEGNTIKDTGRGTQLTGVHIQKGSTGTKIGRNVMSGHSGKDILDQN